MRIRLGLIVLAMSWHTEVFSHSRDEIFTKPGNRRLSEFSVGLRSYALSQILNNVVGANHILFGAAPDTRGLYGAVIAAPSVMADHQRGEVQDYRWRWKRDSAIVMRYLIRVMLNGSLTGIEPSRRISLADAYVRFCDQEQQNHRLSDGSFDLGHAKVTLRAEKNPYEWGYPQNDGPPLENFALYEIFQLYQATQAGSDYIDRLVTVFRRNTDYILQNYRNAQVERWEEEKASSHFSILLEMRGALQLALELGVGDHLHIERVQNEIDQLLQVRHVSHDGSIQSQFQPWLQGSLVRNKYSGLDTQILMSSLFLNKWWDLKKPRFFAPNDPRMRFTFHRLRAAFSQKYHVNAAAKDGVTGERLRGLVFGRYPEDTQHFSGAPWFITTFTAIQFVLWDAIEMHREKEIRITRADLPYFQDFVGVSALENIFGDMPTVTLYEGEPLFKEILNGLIRFAKESFFRVMVHSGEQEVSLTEVLNGVNGYKEGIEHLTWSSVEADKTLRLFEQAAHLGLAPHDILPITDRCSDYLLN